jgi:dUTP pyrophosphatase
MAEQKNKKLVIKYKLLDNKAKAPQKGYDTSAGIDLCALYKYRLTGHSTKVLQTGIAVEIPKGWYGQLHDRSGLGSTTTLKVKAGVIDSEYRGEIGIILNNTGPYPLIIEEGESIAQMVILPVPEITLKETDELSKTDRGTKGYGSTDSA